MCVWTYNPSTYVLKSIESAEGARHLGFLMEQRHSTCQHQPSNMILHSRTQHTSPATQFRSLCTSWL